MSTMAKSGSSFRGWMQSTGHTSTHAVSFVPMHGSQMMYAILLIISHVLASAGCDGAAGSLEVERLGDNLAGCDEVLTALFTPRQPEIGRYEVCTSPSPLERAIADQTTDGFQFSAIERLEPADAFGTAGAYDRFALARLYGGHRLRLA